MFFNVIVCSKIIKIVFINSKSATLSAPPTLLPTPNIYFSPKTDTKRHYDLFNIYVGTSCLCLIN